MTSDSEGKLSLVVGLLAALSVVLTFATDRTYQDDVRLGQFDEARLALAVEEIEAEITRSFAVLEIDASDDSGGGGARQGGLVDATQPNADGVFVVPTGETLERQRRDVLLASKLFYPVGEDAWMELRLSASVPPGPYNLSLQGMISRLGLHGAGGCPLMQVHFAGSWQQLLGTPRRRTQRLEGPRTHHFTAPHPFNGVRVLAAAFEGGEAGGRLALTRLAQEPADVADAHRPLQKRSRYISFELDRGFGAAHLGLFNGLALAYLLNVSCVLPRFHTFHDALGRRRADPGAPDAYVPMDFFYDTAHFIEAMAPMVTIVPSLPPALADFAVDETPQPLDFVNPQLGSRAADAPQLDLARLSRHFKAHNVLLLGPVARRVVWNTPDLARLRLRIHAALRPAAKVRQVADQVDAALRALAVRKGLPSTAYIGLQLPTGGAWAEYCRSEVRAALGGGRGDWLEQCDVPAEAVTHVLEERRVGDLSRILYVASGTLNISQVEHLHRQRFIVMSKARLTVDIHPDHGPALDLALCRRSALFVGNMYSSFSFLLREAKLAAGESERAMYYNMHADATLGDLTREEALRWDVFPLGTHAAAAHAPGGHGVWGASTSRDEL